MNIQDLRYYHELVNLKSYTKTAEKFGVSQPTITAAVKRLERKFDAQFLIRDQSHKSLIITKLGMQFDEHVQSILNEISVAAAEIQQEKEADISFGLPPVIGRNYFPSLVPELLAKGLLNKLKVVESGSYDLIGLLKEGKINFSLLGLTKPQVAPGLKLEIIKHYPIKVIVSKENPLAKKKGIYFREIADQNFIGLNSDYIHTRALAEMVKKNKISLNTIYRSPDVMVVKSLVAQNLGIGYLTELSIDDRDNVVTLPLLDKEQPEFILAAATRENHLMTTKEEALWQILTHK
ncbi:MULTISPECIES: LysR family transcriptional regulator [Lactobacillus]|uniref:LysR family transcriptional regulator n=1 Tax=Lactobacillus xujianguonis TaxID=2495899 RepID=A0A437SSP5_9LACO|nr:MULTISPECIES: LysR family transcriptional regulator [Lactobacillus]RVU69943.1 LysR family transcriptional regulator [Lactobacillus xujianguonis]RVU72299.1 LysR family transcriptional regulator [Lactobacillus xujianguonis]